MAASLGGAGSLLFHPGLRNNQPSLTNRYAGDYSYQRVPNREPTDSWAADGKSKRDRDLEAGSDGGDSKGSKERKDEGKQRRLAELKTTVFDTYAVCAALLSSFSCSTTFISEAELLQEELWRRYTVQTQQILVRVCIIGGIHAMLVFMFCALYAKTALARETCAIEVYDFFSAKTGSIRLNAFFVMYSTAILYCVQIAVSTCYSLPLLWSIGCAILLLLLIARVIWDAQSIIKSAGSIFLPDEAVQKLLDDEKNAKTPSSTSTVRTVSTEEKSERTAEDSNYEYASESAASRDSSRLTLRSEVDERGMSR